MLSAATDAFSRGCLAYAEEDHQACLSAFLDLARAGPDDPSAWSNCGLALREAGSWNEAVRCFRVATLLAPGWEPAWNEWANVLVDTGNLLEAEQLYRHALTLDPSRAVVHHNLGHCLRLAGRHEEAAAAFRAALVREPGYLHSVVELEALAMRQQFT